MKNNLEHRATIKADLARARSTLPESAAELELIRLYEEFINQAELGLACDTLEDYSLEHEVTRDFWLALRNAATKRHLLDHVNRYEQKLKTQR